MRAHRWILRYSLHIVQWCYALHAENAYRRLSRCMKILFAASSGPDITINKSKFRTCNTEIKLDVYVSGYCSLSYIHSIFFTNNNQERRSITTVMICWTEPFTMSDVRDLVLFIFTPLCPYQWITKGLFLFHSRFSTHSFQLFLLLCINIMKGFWS
jgi:hypothetical protein